MDLSPFKQDIDELIDEFAQVPFILFLFLIIFLLCDTVNVCVYVCVIVLIFGSFCDSQDELTTLADMKRVWLSRKFTYIYEACPSTNLSFFMQSLYAHTIRKLCYILIL